MKINHSMIRVSFIICLVLSICGCTTAQKKQAPETPAASAAQDTQEVVPEKTTPEPETTPVVSAVQGSLDVVPSQTVLTPELIAVAPLEFIGIGFSENEMILIEMSVPEGVQVKGIQEGEMVALAYGESDENGDFSSKMDPLAVLSWLFQVGWTPEGAPDFAQATPLPPGEYSIRAVGMTSDIVGTTSLTLLAPPPKK